MKSLKKTRRSLTRREEKQIALDVFNDFNSLLADGYTKTEATEKVRKKYGYKTNAAIFAIRQRVAKQLAEQQNSANA